LGVLILAIWIIGLLLLLAVAVAVAVAVAEVRHSTYFCGSFPRCEVLAYNAQMCIQVYGMKYTSFRSQIQNF